MIRHVIEELVTRFVGDDRSLLRSFQRIQTAAQLAVNKIERVVQSATSSMSRSSESANRAAQSVENSMRRLGRASREYQRTFRFVPMDWPQAVSYRQPFLPIIPFQTVHRILAREAEERARLSRARRAPYAQAVETISSLPGQQLLPFMLPPPPGRHGEQLLLPFPSLFEERVRGIREAISSVWRGAIRSFKEIGQTIITVFSGDRTSEAFQTASNNLIRFNSSIHRILYDVYYLGMRIKYYLVIPLFALGTAAAYAYGRINDSLSRAISLFGKVEEKQKKLISLTIADIAYESRSNIEDLTAALQVFASANYNAALAARALYIAEDFAVASSVEVAQAAQYLISIQNALGLASEDTSKHLDNMRYVSDLLVTSNRIAQGGIEEFAEALTNKGAAAMKLISKDAKEALAILIAFSRVGIEGATAGEKLHMAVRDLTTTFIEHRTVWEQMFGENIIFDREGGMRDMADILSDMEEAFSGMSDEQKTAIMNMTSLPQRSSIAIKMLLGLSNEIRKAKIELNKASGATRQLSDDLRKTFWGEMIRAKNAIVLFLYSIGEILAPAIEVVADFIVRLVKVFRSMSAAAKITVVYLMFAIAAFTAFAIGIMGIVLSVGALISAITTMVTIIGGPATIVILIIAAALLAVSLILLILPVYIGFLIYSIAGADGLIKTLKALKYIAETVFTTILGFLVNLWHNMVAYRNLMLNILFFIPVLLFRSIQAIMTLLNAAWRVITGIIKGVWNALTGKSFAEGFKEELEKSKLWSEGDLLPDKFFIGNTEFKFDIKEDQLKEDINKIMEEMGPLKSMVDSFQDMTKKPINIRFESEGIEAVEVRTAKGLRVLREYIMTLRDPTRGEAIRELMTSGVGVTPFQPIIVPTQLHPGPEKTLSDDNEEVVTLLNRVVELLEVANDIAAKKDKVNIQVAPAKVH